MFTNADLKRNIFLFRLRAFFQGMFQAIFAFIFLFYAQKGFTSSHFGIFEAIIFASVLFFEIPSGIMADRWGYKKTLIIADLFLVCYCTILLLTNNFLLFALAMILYGFSKASYSGSVDALFFNGFKVLNKEHLYMKHKGSNYFIALFFGALFTLLAGYIANGNYLIPLLIAFAGRFLILFTSLLLREPDTKTEQGSHAVAHFITSLSDIFSNFKLKYLVLFSIILTGVVSGFFKFHQLYFKAVGFSDFWIGLIFALMFSIAAFFGKFSESIIKRIGLKGSITLYFVIFPFVYVLMGLFFGKWAAFMILFEAMFVGYSDVLFSDLKNKLIPSSRRATVLSIDNFLASIVRIIIVLFLGFSLDFIGFEFSYIIIGIFVFIFATFFGLKLLKYI